MGFWNSYRKGMPVMEQIGKEVLFTLKIIADFFLKGKVKFIVFAPEYPSKKSVLFQISRQLGYLPTNKWKRNAKIGVCWEDSTIRSRQNFLEEKNFQHLLINRQINDISKSKVDLLMKESFGYGANVNPNVHVGECVEKSEENAKHDGTVVIGPISKALNNSVYQILINNQFNESTVVDYRVPVFNGEIPFIYAKYKSIEIRFGNDTVSSKLHEKEEIFSKEEISKIKLFCNRLELEYGELDILRDKESQKIYIIDVNNTPYGPPQHLTKEKKQEAIDRLTNCFKTIFID